MATFRNPTVVRGPGGQEVAVEDAQGNRPLYSSALVGSDQAVKMTLFRYAKGERVAGMNNSSVDADERHTNSDYSGHMPDSDEMLVYSIAVEFEADIPYAAIVSLMDDLYGEFYTQSEKPLYDGLARHFPCGTGIAGVSTSNEIFTYGNGEANANARTVLNVPVHIAPNKKFKWVFQAPGGALSMATADILCRVVLRGFRTVDV